MKTPIHRENSGANKHGRVRDPVGRSYKSIRGKYPSRKLGRMVQWESHLERDAILLLEYSPGITSYQEQPRKIEYVMDGKVRFYFPDFEICHADGRHGYIEVKPDRIAKRPEEKARFSHIKERINTEGSDFCVLTENEIRLQPLSHNLQTVERYRSSAVRPSQWPEIKHQFRGLTTVTFAQAQTCLGTAERVWALVADGVFSTDLRNDMTDQSIIKINHQRNANGTYLPA